jgi:hypothetical protein
MQAATLATSIPAVQQRAVAEGASLPGKNVSEAIHARNHAVKEVAPHHM